jgi:hypothetical protein
MQERATQNLAGHGEAIEQLLARTKGLSTCLSKKIAHYIRGAAGRCDEGTKTVTLLHFSKGSATEIVGDCARIFAPRSNQRTSKRRGWLDAMSDEAKKLGA